MEETGNNGDTARHWRLELASRLLSREEQERLPAALDWKAKFIESERDKRELQNLYGGHETQARLFFIEALYAYAVGNYARADERLNMLPRLMEARRTGKNKAIYIPDPLEQEILQISQPVVIYFDLTSEQKLAYAKATETLREAGLRVLAIRDRIPSKILSEYIAAPTGEQYRSARPEDGSALRAMLEYSIETSALLAERNREYAVIPYGAGSKLEAALALGGVPLREGAMEFVAALSERHQRNAAEQRVPFVDRSLSNVFVEGSGAFRAHDFETLSQYTTHAHNAADTLRKLHPLLPRADEERYLALFCERHGIADTHGFRIDFLSRAIRIAGQYRSEYPEGEWRAAEDFEALTGTRPDSYTLGGIVRRCNAGGITSFRAR